MSETIPGVESQDLSGSSLHYNGKVGTGSAVAIPNVAGKVISEFCIALPVTAGPTTILYVSVDGGTTFKRLTAGSEWSWSPKGYKKQIHIMASAAATPYEIVMNFEEY